MPPRYDVSSVPGQGGYVAKQCPVRAQNDALLPGEPLPPTPFQERLFKGGREYEADIFAKLKNLHGDTVRIEGSGDAAESATLAAMNSGAKVILAGRLPSDWKGRRVGKPDVLLAAPSGGYQAVDVKHHMSIAVGPPGRQGMAARTSPLDAPWLDQATIDEASAVRKHEGDALQLAHYQRMLEAIGMAACEGRWGGIIGTEQQVVWYDLDSAVWRTPSLSEKTKLRSTMERYDFEFAFRLAVIAVAEQHKQDSSVDLLVVPVKIAECDGCPWWDFCRRVLEEPPGDISLIPRIGWTQWKFHRDRGVKNRAELAALNISTDAERFTGMSLPSLQEQIDQARAALGAEPVYRRRRVEAIVVPRADIEVDVDMETIETGCYLWGAHVLSRTSVDFVSTGYSAFETWEEMTPEADAANSLRFWGWLMGVRRVAMARGLSFRAYGWNLGAENQPLKRMGTAAGILDEVDAFTTSEEWVDLLKVWDEQLITGHSSGLKTVAPIVGFEWSANNAGGTDSMVMYDIAVSNTPAAQQARDWLLTYNEDDVQATLAIREWMAASSVESIEEVRFELLDAAG